MMDIDKICDAAKQLIGLAEKMDLTTEELSAVTTLVSSEMSQRYIAQLRAETDARAAQKEDV
jgi:hypothetical protein